MPAQDPGKDYSLQEEISSDAGLLTVTARCTAEMAPVEVHIEGKDEDGDFVRLRGFTLGGPPTEDNLEAACGIPMKVVNNEPYYYTELRVLSDKNIAEVTYEER